MKAETKHTPGPYSISGIPGDNHIMARNGHDRVSVAIVVGWPVIKQEEFDANRMLLAAAPDMLDALQRIAEIAIDDGRLSVNHIGQAITQRSVDASMAVTRGYFISLNAIAKDAIEKAIGIK